MARLFSYVVARDYGFAPNPFFGVCTLATCKPGIRKTAVPGDWIVGTGSKRKSRSGYFVFVMQVSDALTFNDYWERPEFRRKRPNLEAGRRHAFGDNIYFRDGRGRWHQQNSHHSYADGTPNYHNIRNDTGADRVLLGHKFAYWGGDGPEIPVAFRKCYGVDICAGRGYKRWFLACLVDEFAAWFGLLEESGCLGVPLEWRTMR